MGDQKKKMVGWSLSYAARVDLACFKFCSRTQEFSLAKYSSQLIRNKWLVRVLRWCRIFLTSYSSSPLIRSGGGNGKLVPWTEFLR